MRRPNFVPRAAPPAGRRIQSLCHLQTSGRQGNPAAQSTSSSRPSVGSGHQQFASPSHCSPTFSRDPSIQSARLWCVIFFLHISSLDQRAAVWQSWHLTHFLPIRPSPVPQNCPSPSFLYFYQISTDQSQLCKSLIMKCRILVQEKKCILHLPKNCPEEGCIGEYIPRGQRDFPKMGILHNDSWEILQFKGLYNVHDICLDTVPRDGICWYSPLGVYWQRLRRLLLRRVLRLARILCIHSKSEFLKFPETAN